MYNRQQRRQMEKRLGLFKAQEVMTGEKKNEIRQRRLATGKQIHLQQVQTREQYEEEFATKQYQSRVDYWLSTGVDQEVATAKVDEEYRVENEKFEKKLTKKIPS